MVYCAKQSIGKLYAFFEKWKGKWNDGRLIKQTQYKFND